MVGGERTLSLAYLYAFSALQFELHVGGKQGTLIFDMTWIESSCK